MAMKKFKFLTSLCLILLLIPSIAFALFPYPRFKAIDGNGNPIRGGLLYFYEAGTSTAKDSYTDKACTTAATNPVVLDSNGEATIYLLGTYKVNLKNRHSAQMPGWPIDNIDGAAGATVGASYPTADAADHGATGDSNTIKYYVDTIGTTKKGTIYLRHDSGGTNTDYVFATSDDYTNNGNINFVFEKGARLDPDTAKTVTFHSPENLIASAGQGIITGSGAIAFSVKGEGYANWWGFDPAATAANNDTYITAALTALGGGTVTIGKGGTYACNPFPISTIGTTLKGLGYHGGGVIIDYASGTTTFITVDANNTEIRDLRIIGPDAVDGNGDIGIDIQDGKWRCVIDGVRLDGFDTAIKDDGFDNSIQNTMIYDFGAVGIEYAGGANANIYNTSISDTGTSGKCIMASGILTHLSCDKVIFGSSEYGIYESPGSIRNITLKSCHMETPSINDIYNTSTSCKVNIIGGRYTGTIRAAASGALGSRYNIIGSYFTAAAITNDTKSVFVLSNSEGITGADISGTVAELHNIEIDESGNIVAKGSLFVDGSPIYMGEAGRSTYAARSTTITNNSTTAIFKATVSNVCMSGIVTVSATRAANNEQSSHHYSVHSDPGGVTVDEIGTGRDRGAAVSITAAVAGSDLTFSIVTDANWSGDSIVVAVSADLTGTATITYTDL